MMNPKHAKNPEEIILLDFKRFYIKCFTFDISDFKQIDPKVLDYAATRLQVMIITMIGNDQIIFIKIMTR